MKDIFKDVLGIEGVRGVIAFDAEGGPISSRFSSPGNDWEAAVARFDWNPFLHELGEIAETEFLFESYRIYARKNQSGCLLVVLEDIAPIAMVRLNCEILLPALERAKPVSSKIGKILRKKIF